MQTDYIPRPDGAFLEWVKNLYAYALTHYTGWSVPSPQTSLETPLNAYDGAYTAAQNPNRGKADVLRKNETRKALETAIRVYVKAYLINNPAVTDEDKTAMGLPVYSHTRPATRCRCLTPAPSFLSTREPAAASSSPTKTKGANTGASPTAFMGLKCAGPYWIIRPPT
jgi:hypothetical protein